MRKMQKNIDVIATFRVGEPPQPHRFRVQDRYGNIHEMKIGRILRIDKTRILGDDIWTYRCQGIVGNLERIYEIQYNIPRAGWQLVKI